LFFFLSGLILSICTSSALFIGLLKALQINWERRNRRPISYLSPVLLTVVLLVLTVSLAVPRLLDTVQLIAGSLEIDEIQVGAGDIGWNTLKDGKRRFTYSQWKYDVKPGHTYQITYTPRSHAILNMTEVVEQPDVIRP
jgi:hypothetical protein